MSEHPKAIIALQLANASVLVVNSENLHVMRDGLLDMKKDVELLIREKGVSEARHAEEMRELKERFSEVALFIDGVLEEGGFVKAGPMRTHLAPFIIPAPDPLVEIAREMTLLDGVVRTDNQKAAIREGRAGSTASEDFYDRLRAAMQARGYEWRKIGEAGE